MIYFSFRFSGITHTHPGRESQGAKIDRPGRYRNLVTEIAAGLRGEGNNALCLYKSGFRKWESQ